MQEVQESEREGGIWEGIEGGKGREKCIYIIISKDRCCG